MKRIICLFGHPGSGVKTFVKSIYNKDDKLIGSLDLEGKNIFYIEPTYKEEEFPSYDMIAKDRIKNFDKNLYNLLCSDIDVLLVKCGFVDFLEYDRSTLKYIADNYPEIEKEIVFLLPSDPRVGYKRLIETEWFNKDIKTNTYKFTYDWYMFSTSYIKEHLLKYKNCHYKYHEIDTSDGYIFTNDGNKKLELK